MPRDIFIASPSGLSINLHGQASVERNQYCTWQTSDGSTDTCVITNPGTVNTLTFVVSGAPPEIMCTDGCPFNGQHTIPPDNPTTNVTAIGNFKGQQVIIFNMSALDTECLVVAVSPGAAFIP